MRRCTGVSYLFVAGRCATALPLAAALAAICLSPRYSAPALHSSLVVQHRCLSASVPLVTNVAPPSLQLVGSEASTQAALVAVFEKLTTSRKGPPAVHRRGIAVRELATLLPDDVLEYLGEEHGGLAHYCRVKHSNNETIISPHDAVPRKVTFAENRGVGVVFLTPLGRRARSDREAPESGLRPPPGAARSAEEYVASTLIAVFGDCPVPLTALQARWSLPTAAGASARALSLVCGLAEWRSAVHARHGSDQSALTFYPTVNVETGELSPESAERIRATARKLAPDTDAIPWSSLATMIYKDGELLLLQVTPSALTQRMASRRHAEAESRSDVEDDASASSDQPQPYDLYRLGAHLDVGTAKPVAVVKCAGAAVTVFHPLHIALSYPTQMKIHYGPEVPGDASRAGGEGPLGACVLALSPGRIREALGVSYVLDECDRAILTPNASFAHMSTEELEAAREATKHNYSPLKQIRLRKRYARELFRRHFPQGNPFLHGEVVAQYLYDNMEPGRWCSNSVLKDEMLPGGGKDTMHVGVGFFDMFPHLFVVQHQTSSQALIMRREEDMINVHGDEALEGTRVVFSNDELHLMLLSMCFEIAQLHQDAPLIPELVLSKLPRYHRMAIRQRAKSNTFFEAFIRAYPSAFEALPEGKFRLNTTAGAALANKLATRIASSVGKGPTSDGEEYSGASAPAPPQ